MGKEQLFEAVKKGDVAGVVAQLEAGVDIESQDEFGQTALHIAAMNDQPNIIKILIEKGASIDARDGNDWTPLYGATLDDNLKCALILLQNNANPNVIGAGDGCTPLILAANNGNKDLITLLIKSGAEVNAATKSGWTALHSAADKFVYGGGNSENIELLLSYGAISIKNFLGHTPEDIVTAATDISLSDKVFGHEVAPLGESE